MQSRTGIAAIAAVLALSSTPLFAQDTGVADPVVETPVPTAPDPLAPEPVASPPPAATETTSDTSAEPAAAPTKSAARSKASAAPAKSARSSAARTAPVASSAAPAPAATAAPEIAAAPALPPAAESAPVSEPVAPPPAESTSILGVDVPIPEGLIPVAGGTALGLLGIGGIAMAMRRRKRRKEEDRLEAAKWAAIEASAEREAQAEREPAFARAAAPIHDPVPARTQAPAGRPATTLPNGFDISRFGPHVQAAYRGPTPDNPSYSLKNRLTRAAFYDRQERRAAEEVAAIRRPAEAPAKTGWAESNKAEFILRKDSNRAAPLPAYQK